MKARTYTVQQRGTTMTAVVRVGAKGGVKTVAVYSNPDDARDVADALNRHKREEI